MVGGARVPRPIVGGQQEPESEHEVDLGDDDLVGVFEVEHHDVHDAVGQLDLGTLVALEDVLDDERMERKERADLLDLVVGRTAQVHPDRRVGVAQELGQLGESRRALPFLGPALDGRGDPHRAGARVGDRGAVTGDRLAGAAGRAIRG